MLRRCDLRLGEKGGDGIGKTRKGKGVKIMAMVDRHGLPVAVCTESAQRAEVSLVQLLFDFMFIEVLPERLIGDRAYDSDKLDEELRQRGVEMYRTQPLQPLAIPGWPSAAALQAPVEGRAVLRLAAQLPAAGKPVGTQGTKLPSLGGTRLCHHPPQCTFEIASRGPSLLPLRDRR